MKNKVFSWVFILFWVFHGGMISSTPLVLCFGADGHVRIETEKTDRLRSVSERFSDPDHDPAAVLRYQTPADDCGDCLDVPFLFSILIRNEISDSDLLLTGQSPVSMLENRRLVSTAKDLPAEPGFFYAKYPDRYPLLNTMSLLI